VTTITVAEAGKHLDELVDEVCTSGEPVVIAGTRSSAVLVGEDDWRAVQETLSLLSAPGIRESVLEGMSVPVDECKTGLDW
jgi:prevent-host-death family protein